MHLNIQKWLRFSLCNLTLVALAGLLMRYKIGFEFPYFEQENVEHGHSHFAFAGWVGHTLMVLMVYLFRNDATINLKKYNTIFTWNLVAAYGMLLFFIIQGYRPISIVFSTLSMLVSFVFAYVFLRDLKRSNVESLIKRWFAAATIFSVISTFGTLVLIYMMVSHNFSDKVYLASIYYYLHFQYNGLFIFTCMGLFYAYADLRFEQHPAFRQTFWIFAISCVPAYLLSVLWFDLPLWLYWIGVLAAIAQVFAWCRFLFVLLTRCKYNLPTTSPLLRNLLVFIGMAMTIKVFLQLGSTVPQMSHLAFGFRPIVIAYLHLVLLAIISLFLLFYIFAEGLLPISKTISTGLTIFIIGVIANEVVLAIQGIASLYYIPVPYVNKMLFGAAIILVSGIGTMAIYSVKNRKLMT